VIAAGWPDLVDELDRWQQGGRVAKLWWRDDDATAPSLALDRLISIAGKIPVALAVIPALAQPELAEHLLDYARLGWQPEILVLQHGWRHVSHSATGKKSEFPAGRSDFDIRFELAAGRERLSELFGTRALPVLVPPWNRFDDCLLPLLGGCRLSAISRAKPRRSLWPVPFVCEVNVHVDLVGWAADRGFIGEEAALGALVAYLRECRLGGRADEPTGILTHHLVQDERTDEFVQRLLEVTDKHAGAHWLDAREVFAEAMPVAI
jgi:hypothetical protein